MSKIFFNFLILIILTGCVQSTAMVGPAVTLVSTGNFAHAGLSFGANKAVEKETGMSTTELISKTINENDKEIKQNEMHESLITLIDLNFHKTRKIILDNKGNY